MNAPYDDSDDDLSDDARRSRRVRFELIFASVWLAIGLFALPAAIYWVGTVMLGSYGEKAGLSTFYGDFFGDLSEGAGRAWTLALAPVVLVYAIRAVFIGMNGKTDADSSSIDEDDEPKKPVRRASAPRTEIPRAEIKEQKDLKETKRPAARASRVEPRVGN